MTTSAFAEASELVLDIEANGKLARDVLSPLHPVPCRISQPAFNLTPDTGHY